MDAERYSVAGAICMLVAITLGLVAMITWEPEEPVARSYTTGWYVEQGGDKAVVASGGELEVQSGATLDVQSGASVTMTGYVTSALDSLTVTNTVQAEHLRSTDDAVVDDALTANSATVTGTVQAEHLRSTDDAVVDDALTANSVTASAISVTAPITVSGYGFTYTAPITITGVLSNVRLLYYQIP